MGIVCVYIYGCILRVKYNSWRLYTYIKWKLIETYSFLLISGTGAMFCTVFASRCLWCISCLRACPLVLDGQVTGAEATEHGGRIIGRWWIIIAEQIFSFLDTTKMYGIALTGIWWAWSNNAVLRLKVWQFAQNYNLNFDVNVSALISNKLLSKEDIWSTGG